MEEARRDAEEGIMSAFIFNDPFRGRQVFTNPGEVLSPEVKLDWDFLEPRTLLVGSPENVVERVQELQEVCHLDYLLVEFTHMGMPLGKTLRNLETFAAKVMPRFAGDGLKHGHMSPPDPLSPRLRSNAAVIGAQWRSQFDCGVCDPLRYRNLTRELNRWPTANEEGTHLAQAVQVVGLSPRPQLEPLVLAS